MPAPQHFPHERNILNMNALICRCIVVFRDFYGVSFGDERYNVVNGLACKALAEVMSELTPNLGTRLDL
jgi:hypothetical protein